MKSSGREEKKKKKSEEINEDDKNNMAPNTSDIDVVEASSHLSETASNIESDDDGNNVESNADGRGEDEDNGDDDGNNYHVIGHGDANVGDNDRDVINDAVNDDNGDDNNNVHNLDTVIIDERNRSPVLSQAGANVHVVAAIDNDSMDYDNDIPVFNDDNVRINSSFKGKKRNTCS